MDTKNMQKKQIYFPDQQLQLLDELVKRTGLPLAAHVRQAVREYLEKPENQFLSKEKNEYKKQ